MISSSGRLKRNDLLSRSSSLRQECLTEKVIEIVSLLRPFLNFDMLQELNEKKILELTNKLVTFNNSIESYMQ